MAVAARNAPIRTVFVSMLPTGICFATFTYTSIEPLAPAARLGIDQMPIVAEYATPLCLADRFR